jgi:hypothetical protein
LDDPTRFTVAAPIPALSPLAMLLLVLRLPLPVACYWVAHDGHFPAADMDPVIREPQLFPALGRLVSQQEVLAVVRVAQSLEK